MDKSEAQNLRGIAMDLTKIFYADKPPNGKLTTDDIFKTLEDFIAKIEHSKAEALKDATEMRPRR